MSEEHGVSISLLGKTYQIKSPTSDIASLHKAAAYLDTKLHAMRNSGKVLNAEQLALLTALNISHELEVLKDQERDYVTSMSARIQALHSKIEAIVAEEVVETIV